MVMYLNFRAQDRAVIVNAPVIRCSIRFGKDVDVWKHFLVCWSHAGIGNKRLESSLSPGSAIVADSNLRLVGRIVFFCEEHAVIRKDSNVWLAAVFVTGNIVYCADSVPG